MRHIGGRASIAYGNDLLNWLDKYAADQGITRARAVRAILLQFAVQYERAHTPATVLPDVIRGWRVIGDGEDLARRRRAAAPE